MTISDSVPRNSMLTGWAACKNVHYEGTMKIDLRMKTTKDKVKNLT